MKSILLIGLGRFGRHIAQELNELGHQVMAIDSGGKFSGKAYNHVTNTVYAPAAVYQWQAITDGDNLKWAVVPATR